MGNTFACYIRGKSAAEEDRERQLERNAREQNRLQEDDGNLEERLWRLEYTSKLLVEPFEEELTAIISHAGVVNGRKGIGGILVGNSDTKVVHQVLEGPWMAVRELWEKIRKDRRHEIVDVFYDDSMPFRTTNRVGMVQVSNWDYRNNTEMRLAKARPDHRPPYWVVEYKSRMVVDLFEQEVEEIVNRAQVNNDSCRIGGFLTADPEEGTVHQMFEGHKDAVQALWEKIRADPRHKIYEVIQNQATTVRVSGRWGMAIVSDDEYSRRMAEKIPLVDAAEEAIDFGSLMPNKSDQPAGAPKRQQEVRGLDADLEDEAAPAKKQHNAAAAKTGLPAAVAEAGRTIQVAI